MVERGLAGGANSTRTGGGIRQQFGTRANIELSKIAAPFWERFKDRSGVDPLFRPIGYLFLAHSENNAHVLRQQVALQHSLDVDSLYLDGDATGRRWPALTGRGFVAGSFRQSDGWANQHRIVDGLFRMAIDSGVAAHLGTDCLNLRTTGPRVTGVDTTAGTIWAEAVVLATGPWGAGLLGPPGLSREVAAHRHELRPGSPS